ncbi:diacylglycerol kinase family protein [Rubrolithibacter danxiaensis]|uniref:diacylglycerol kinase family protein n=1 Tax=Rubrolithibacter danxiaensis TaxID=3390805 RepID=UPI003BF7AFF5
MNKLIKSFGYAIKGIIYAAKTQVNFQIHLVAALSAIILGFYFKISVNEWLWIILCIGLVLIVELLNTAIEVLVDLISPQFNKKAGVIKDIAAGAVLTSAILAIAIGLFIFIPKILPILNK